MNSTSSYEEIKNKEEIKNDLLKPLHLYAQKISPKPKFLSDNILLQKNYSEHYINSLSKDKIYMVSRPAIQQFRKSDIKLEKIPENCFPTIFEFYVSWFIDIDKDVKITNCNSEESPFYILNDVIINFKKKYKDLKGSLDPLWIPFLIKKDSKYLKGGYGRIPLDVGIYEIHIGDNK